MRQLLDLMLQHLACSIILELFIGSACLNGFLYGSGEAQSLCSNIYWMPFKIPRFQTVSFRDPDRRYINCIYISWTRLSARFVNRFLKVRALLPVSVTHDVHMCKRSCICIHECIYIDCIYNHKHRFVEPSKLEVTSHTAIKILMKTTGNPERPSHLQMPVGPKEKWSVPH